MANTVEKTGHEIFLELDALMIFLNSLGYQTENLTVNQIYDVKADILKTIAEKSFLIK